MILNVFLIKQTLLQKFSRGNKLYKQTDHWCCIFKEKIKMKSLSLIKAEWHFYPNIQIFLTNLLFAVKPHSFRS